MRSSFFGIACVLVVLIALGVTYVIVNDTRDQGLLASDVAEVTNEYVRCIGLEDDGVIGQCLNDLAASAYEAHSVGDIAAAMNTLSFEQKDHWCHETMHYLGWRAFEVEGDISQAFLVSSELCDSGMYHGVVERYLRQEGLDSDLPTFIGTVCEESLEDHPDSSEGTRSLCYHGLGHGLMYITASDLQGSLDLCDTLPQNIGDCYGGVYMEYAANKEVAPPEGAAEKDLSDPTYCQSLSQAQQSSCYGRQGINNLMVTKGDVDEAMRLCQRLPQEHHYNCFQGVGANTPSPGRSHENAAEACLDAQQVSETAYQACITGAIGFVIQLDRGEAAGAIAFCEHSDQAERSLCYTHTGTVLKEWLKEGERIEEVCATVPKDMRDVCIGQ